MLPEWTIIFVFITGFCPRASPLLMNNKHESTSAALSYIHAYIILVVRKSRFSTFLSLFRYGMIAVSSSKTLLWPFFPLHEKNSSFFRCMYYSWVSLTIFFLLDSSSSRPLCMYTLGRNEKFCHRDGKSVEWSVYRWMRSFYILPDFGCYILRSHLSHLRTYSISYFVFHTSTLILRSSTYSVD